MTDDPAMTTMGRAAARVGRVAVLLALAGCQKDCTREKDDPHDDDFDLFCGTYSSGKRSTEHYLAVRGKKGVSGASNVKRMPGELWGPFRVELTTWVLGDGNDVNVRNATSGLEVDVRGSQPFSWWAVRTHRTQTGFTAWATSHEGTVLGSADFPDAAQLALAIAYDGAKLRLFARDLSITVQTPFVELANVDYVQTLPMNPGFSVSGVDAGVTVAFDDADVVSNGAPPVPRDAAHQAFQDVAEAADAIGDAIRVIDGILHGNPADAAAPLDTATTKLAAVRTYVTGLPGKSTPKKRALTAIGKVSKAVASAKSTLAKKGDNGIGAALKKLFPTLTQLGTAGAEIAPADLLVPLPDHDL